MAPSRPLVLSVHVILLRSHSLEVTYPSFPGYPVTVGWAICYTQFVADIVINGRKIAIDFDFPFNLQWIKMMPQSYYKPQREIFEDRPQETKLKCILEHYCSLLQFISSHEELALILKSSLTCSCKSQSHFYVLYGLLFTFLWDVQFKVVFWVKFRSFSLMSKLILMHCTLLWMTADCKVSLKKDETDMSCSNQVNAIPD